MILLDNLDQPEDDILYKMISLGYNKEEEHNVLNRHYEAAKK